MKKDVAYWARIATIIAAVVAVLEFLRELFGWGLPWSPWIGILLAVTIFAAVLLWVFRELVWRLVRNPLVWSLATVTFLALSGSFYRQRSEMKSELTSARATQTAQAQAAAELEFTRVAQATEIASARVTVTKLSAKVATLQAMLTPTVTPTPGVVSVRSGPSRYHAAVDTVRQGDQVAALAEYTNRDDERWYKIETEEGSLGWVPASSVERANPEGLLPIGCPFSEGLTSDEGIFKALIEAETRAVLEESNLERNERLALIYLAFAKDAKIYDMSTPLRPWTDPIARYMEKLNLEINSNITHTLFSLVSITPFSACMLTDSHGVYESRAAPTPTPYDNSLGSDEWYFVRINGCWAIRQFVFRINPNDPKHGHEPCALDWPTKQ